MGWGGTAREKGRPPGAKREKGKAAEPEEELSMDDLMARLVVDVGDKTESASVMLVQGVVHPLFNGQSITVAP